MRASPNVKECCGGRWDGNLFDKCPRCGKQLNEANGSPFRVQLSRRKGWKLPANTVVVSRPTKWGNPFIVVKHGTRERCVELFRLLCAGYQCISLGGDVCDAQKSFIAHAKANLQALRGKNLACWCPLNKPCHADVLLEMANAGTQP